MGFLHSLIGVSLAIFTGSNAAPSSALAAGGDISSLIRRQNSGCTNTATSRSCWSNGFDINTDWYQDTPKTGNVREYWLEVTNSTAAPDGFQKQVLLFNNTYPGPTITADWGDTIRVHVTNKLAFNGTSIHWHGIRQLGTNEQDGVGGITQCPLAPSDTMTYEFEATQYGTTWYHSHFSLQYGEGVLGPLVINGPASADYDVDVGPVIVQDWYHNTIFSLYDQAKISATIPSQGGLVNGHGVWKCAADDGPACIGGGTYWNTTFEKGKKYRLRFINTSVDTVLALSLDNHNLTVIAADLVPVKPFSVKYLPISMGQRYDVVIEANASIDNYWLRAHVHSFCGATNTNADILAIVRYAGASTTSDPTSTLDVGDSPPNDCEDISLSLLNPVVTVTPDSSSFSSVVQPITISLDAATPNPVGAWRVNGAPIDVDWSNPILNQQYNGQNYSSGDNTLILPNKNEWVYFVIVETSGATHPIHLHGHDFSLLKQAPLSASGDYDLSDVNFNSPMRRDVAVLPGKGYIVIGFETDNPGSWIMHCHIAWHVSSGLGMNFMERPDEIIGAIGDLSGDWNTTCNNWRSYDGNDDGGTAYQKDDSGLRRMMFEKDK